MLIVTRQVGESLILKNLETGEITVVKQLKKGRWGVTASSNVRILREELIERKEAA